MELVVEDVHDPGGEEGRPPNEDQADDMGLCHNVGVTMHIYEHHPFRSHKRKSSHCQSE